mgnify:FL=1
MFIYAESLHILEFVAKCFDFAVHKCIDYN